MSLNLEKFIKNDWTDLKEIIQSKWSKLTSQDINEIQGSYDILIGKMKKLYGTTRKEIEKELNQFLLSEEFDELKNKFSEKAEELKNGFSLNDTVEKYVKCYLQSLKDKTGALEENVVSYAKENPFKILGTAVLVGFALAKMWSNKHN